MQIRDRIKEFKRVKASELRPNPKNWRSHPVEQQDALRGVLAEIGFADAVLARELDDGSLQLIDGHLRVDVAPDAQIPVLVLDVDQAAADKILLTHDPLAAMAKADAVKLDSLLREIDTGSDALQSMLAELANDAGLYKTAGKTTSTEVPASRESEAESVDAAAETDMEQRPPIDGENDAVVVGQSKHCVVIECDDGEQQQLAYQWCIENGYRCRMIAE